MPRLVFALLLLSTALIAQTPRDAEPQPAIPALLAAFQSVSVVAVGDMHRTKDINDFVLTLVRQPAFADTVNDIVVEATNSFLQPTLDRYVNGEPVPDAEARMLWRDDTSAVGASDHKAHLIQLARAINRGRPPQARLRVIAAEAPVDWSTQGPAAGADMDRRERRIADVVKRKCSRANARR
jgi:hypothetical protein